MHKQPTYRRISSLMALLLAVSALLGLFGHSVKATALAQTPNPTANPYGVNLLLDDEVESWKKERTFYLAAQANVQYVKQEFPWNELEFSKGNFFDKANNKSAWDKYDELVADAEKYGLTMVARLDRTPDWARGPNTSPGTPPTNYQDYADFVVAFLKHYNGRIKYIQIWNEPNLRAEWDTGQDVDASAYTKLLKLVYTQAKAADPNVTILSAPMAINTLTKEGADHSGLSDLEYWKEMYAAGVKGSFDIASANTYGLRDTPDAAPDPGVLNYRRVELLHQIMVDNGDGDKQIWFNEYGWNANPGATIVAPAQPTLTANQIIQYGQVSPQVQAQYTVDGINYARQNWPWAGVIFIWYLRQTGVRFAPNDPQYYFAMVNPDFSVNPIYSAVQQAASAFPGPAKNGALPQPATPPAGVTLPTEAVPSPTVGTGGGVLVATATVSSLIATITPLAFPSSTPAPATATSAPVLTATNAPAATPVPLAPASSGDNSTLLIVIVVVVAILLVGGVLFFLRKPPTAQP